MRRAVLLFLHQGRGFPREAAAAAARHGLDLVALSSRTANGDVPTETLEHLADCLMGDGEQLTGADTADVVARYAERGFTIEAAVATYEGYRLLMADLNHEIGARDSSVEALRLCLNKHAMRRFLVDHGLSAVRHHLLDGRELPELDRSARWFVKPVRGASSFAAFLLDDPQHLQELPQLQEQMRNDSRMAAIFMDQYDFLVEEYVDGPEFSFETVLLTGTVHHLCVHEKARVDRLPRTTLEAMSISPPVGVDHEVLVRGSTFVTRCLLALGALGLTAGVLHIEAKYWVDRDRWEIIEINPRMGGSMINQSVEIITGESVLDVWTDSLVLPPEGLDQLADRLTKVSQLAALDTGTAPRATVFLSKYGEKGRTVDTISFDPGERVPAQLKMHVGPGTTLDESDRAICLMDALWEVDPRILAREAAALDRHATEGFHVSYR